MECPECGSDDTDSWTEEQEYGRPTNLNTTGAVAPNYRTMTVRMKVCNDCEWMHREEV